MVGIYKITNLINEKVYIGKAVDIKHRWKEHKRDAFKKDSRYYNKYLYRAIRKYGLNNFSFEIIEECTVENLNDREIYWIKEYQSFPPELGKGYNLYPGGEGNYCRLNNNQVLEIINLLKNTNLTNTEIAKKYNICYDLITEINQGKNYNIVGVNYPIRDLKEFYKSIRKNWIQKNIINLKPKYPIPPKPELLTKFNEFNYMREDVANFYGVSGNLLRKWCHEYNFRPQQKSEVKKLYLTEVLGQEVKEKRSRNIKVAQVDPETNEIINIFNTRKEVEKLLQLKPGCNKPLISAINNHKIYKNYYWEVIQ